MRHALLLLISLSHHEATVAQTGPEQMPQESTTSKEPQKLAMFGQPEVPRELTAPATPATLARATPAAPKELTVLDQVPATAALTVPIKIPPKRPGKTSKDGDEEIEGAQGEKVSIYGLFLFLVSDCLGRSLSANVSERLLKWLSLKSLSSAVLQYHRPRPISPSTQTLTDLLGNPLSPSILRFVLLLINSIHS